MKKRYAFLSVLGLLAMVASSQAFDLTFTTVAFPGADVTTVSGVSGSTVVGTYYNDTNGISGTFIYDGSTFTKLNYPGSTSTTILGISGSTVFGYYDDSAYADHAFIYNGSTFTTLSYPGSTSTTILGISDGTVVGTYNDSAHAFIYNGSTFTTLDYPGSTNTRILGISGGTAVGTYNDSAHAFIYNGSTFTTLNYPGSTSTTILGISGGTVFGIYYKPDEHPFTYNGSTFTTLYFPDYSVLPNAGITGISGSIVVGVYQPGPGISEAAFVYDGSDDGSAVEKLGGGDGSFTSIVGISGNTAFGSSFSDEYDEENDDYESYGDGFVFQFEVPEPQISLTTSNTIVVSWPYPSTGWNLQQNSDLTATNWVTPSGAVAYDGTNDFINVDPRSGTQMFFRLIH
jgi:hypothetical protein